MKIVTSGKAFTDIDAYAGIVAYAELLRAGGHEATAVTTAPLNASVPNMVQAWQPRLERSYQPAPDDTYTLIDISEPEYFERFVRLEQVEAILDHHPGFEDYWRERLGTAAHIEFIGAACTLVYEAWEAAGLLHDLSQTSAKLLVCGILDNTLNFKAHVATDRDKAAYDGLMAHAQLPGDWPAQYFRACQETVLADTAQAIRDDAKTIAYPRYPEILSVGQLVVWDAKAFLKEHQETIAPVLTSIRPEWYMNLVSIDEGSSYFVCQQPEVKTWLAGLLGVKFEGDVAKADRLWLRKEIMQRALNLVKPL